MSGFDFDAIRRANPLKDVVAEVVDLTKKGNEYHGLCPFHDERTPSFQVVPEKGFYHCHGCGAHGDVIDFVANVRGISVGQAAHELAGQTQDLTPQEREDRDKALQEREEREQRKREKATASARDLYESADIPDPNHPYLVKKGVQAFGCRQLPDGRLILPIMDFDGNIMSVQTIDDKGRKKFHTGAPVSSGGMNVGFYFGGETVICEGYATGWSIHDDTKNHVRVAFSMGNMEKIARELISKGRSIILAADKGQCAEKMQSLSRELGVPAIIPPDDIEGSDFNDLYSERGKGAVRAHFDNQLHSWREEMSMRQEAPKVDQGPVDLWSEQDVPDFPINVFPPVIERYSLENAAALGSDPAGLALTALGACAAAIRDSIKLAPRSWDKGWKESARIWPVLIGKPSTKKSPVLSRSASPIKAIDKQMLKQGQARVAEWEENGKEGPKPDVPRIVLEDATTEAAQEKFGCSPNGILLLQDELSGFFGRIEKYGGGSADRGFWLQSYNGGSYAIDRIGRGSKVIENLSACMIGGVQPEALRSIADKSDDDGLIQRIIPVMLRPGRKSERVDATTSNEAYRDLVFALHKMEGPGGSFFKDNVHLEYDPEAEKLAAEFSDINFDRVQAFEDIHGKFASHLGKYDGLFSRLCVVFHCIENVSAPSKTISYSTAARVRVLIESFIMRHSMAFYIGLLGMSENDQIMKDVAGSILAHGDAEISNRELMRRVRTYRKANQYERDEVTKTLVALGWLEPLGGVTDKENKWKVSPETHAKFEQKAESERIRRAEVTKIIKQTVAESNSYNEGES